MNLKKLVALLMALLMLLSMAAVAEDVEEEDTTTRARTMRSAIVRYTVTIRNSDDPNHKYEAFQIFKGTVATDGSLTEIDWGSGVNGKALLETLKKKTAYQNCTDANDVAEVIAEFKDDSPELFDFADTVVAHINQQQAINDDDNNVFEDLQAGYYLIRDAKETSPGHSQTRYLLRVTENIIVDAKDTCPELSKGIVATEDDPATEANELSLVDSNDAAVGDTVKYMLNSKVPDMKYYNRFYFVVKDTMSKGLTFNDDVAITINGTDLVEDEDFTVSSSGIDSTDIEIVILEFKANYDDQKDAPIVITYSATVNENAVIGTPGNDNKVHLQYSSNPNFVYEGNKPGGDTTVPTGVTPEDVVRTYVTEIELTKLDEKGNELTGAQFNITGTSMNRVQITSTEFVAADDGTYYKLKDGKYTTEAPTENDPTTPDVNEDNSASYDSTTIKYRLETKSEWVTVSESVSLTQWVDANGKLKFTGLSEGTYTITETVAPNTYKKLDNPITVVVTFVPGNGTTEAHWTYTVDNGEPQTTNKTIGISVTNVKGSVLPSTGGMGTTVLYIAGGIMVLAAFVLIVSKKRAAAE